MSRRVLIFALSVPLASALLASQAPTADTVLLNGTVITVDPRDSIAEAVAIANGKIAFVGSTAEARSRVGEKTQVIDLAGRTATPGLIDTHVHFSEPADNLDLGDARSMDEVIRRVRAFAERVPAGQWVRGGGWDEGKLAERRYITAADLDKASPDRPIYLTHTTGHYGVANSLALKLSNITKDTADPPGGTIDRDRDGNPTGVLKERATSLIARGSGGGGRGNDTMRADVLRIIEGFNREGMTGAKDLNVSPAKFALYKSLLEEGKLNVRVTALWRGGATIESARQAMEWIRSEPRLPQTLGDGRLVSAGVKLYIDGSGGARTAWMYDDWNKDLTGTDTGNKGYPANGESYPAIYKQQVMMLTEAGINVGTHAVGDRGIDFVMQAYDEALKAHPIKGLRHSIIHANVPTDAAIRKMAEMQKTYDAGYPEAQAPFLWWIGDTYAGNFGAARNPRLEPFRSYLNNGVMWAGGSDYSVTPYAARYGLWASVARETLAGTYGKTPFGMAESIDIHNALKSYTIWAARQMFLETRVGSLEAGKDADIAVWDRNMYTVASAALKDLRCQLTMVAGKVVYRGF
ncbi:MAG TPA: amidohydrolase [Vicinamibacterales bacterium]|nr:amidohydrolase [Vicinamibacterales bacterium]